MLNRHEDWSLYHILLPAGRQNSLLNGIRRLKNITPFFCWSPDPKRPNSFSNDAEVLLVLQKGRGAKTLNSINLCPGRVWRLFMYRPAFIKPDSRMLLVEVPCFVPVPTQLPLWRMALARSPQRALRHQDRCHSILHGIRYNVMVVALYQRAECRVAPILLHHVIINIRASVHSAYSILKLNETDTNRCQSLHA
jgi:hypothetical protein